MSAAQPHILIADDSRLGRLLLSKGLRGAGYQVSETTTGVETLTTIGERPIDALLMNWRLPDLSSRTILTTLRRDFSPIQLPIIAISASEDDSSITEALEIGANDFVTRPLSMPAVIARLRTHIRMAQMEADLRQRNQLLQQAQERTAQELAYAGRIQRSLLPTDLPEASGWRFASAYHPCEDLGGDSLIIDRIDAHHMGVGISDVSGHGVGASLLAVTLSHMLRSSSGQSMITRQIGDVCEAVEPLDVADQLNQSFQISSESLQYFTLLYGLLDLDAHSYRYIQAGHPSPIHDTPQEAAYLPGTGLPIGLMPEGHWHEGLVLIQPGERLWLYSDGLTEAHCGDHELFGRERLCAAIHDVRDEPLPQAIEKVLQRIRAFCHDEPQADDYAVLVIERPTESRP